MKSREDETFLRKVPRGAMLGVQSQFFRSLVCKFMFIGWGASTRIAPSRLNQTVDAGSWNMQVDNVAEKICKRVKQQVSKIAVAADARLG